MRTKGSPDELEHRRRLAVQRSLEGYSADEIAEFLGISSRTVWRWLASYRDRGPQGLTARPIPGRPPKLTVTQEKITLRWLRGSPVEHGFATELWTAPRLAQLIEEEFAVRFNPRWLSTWLRDRGFTPQKRVRSVKPVLRPVLRSGHGRKGVSHGAGDVGSGTRVVLATGPGTLAAERPVGAGLLPGRGRQRAAALLVAAQARADQAQGAGLRPGARRHRAGRRTRDPGHRGGPGQRPVPPRRAGVRPPHPRGARRPPGSQGALMLSLPPTV